MHPPGQARTHAYTDGQLENIMHQVASVGWVQKLFQSNPIVACTATRARAALCKDISLQIGRSCARSLASCIPRSSEDRSSGMFFIQVVRGRPGGRLQFSTGSPKKLLEEYKYDRLGVYSCHICGQMRCIPWLQNSPPQPSSHAHCHGWSHLPY